jgi:hypothetical protein
MSHIHKYLFLTSALLVAAHAQVVKIAIERTEPQGSYERITGHISGELDPGNPLNAIITDIQFAPRNARGRVEYSATFTLLKPADMGKASGVLEYGVANRGDSPLTGTQVSDGMAAGHVLLSSGWQGDVEPRAGMESISVPAARHAD